MALNFINIFTDFNSDGLRESFREFLGYFVKQFYPLVNTQLEQLYLARLDYPLVALPLYLLAIGLFWRLWSKPTTGRAIAASIAAGILFYTYFHFWVYWVIVLGLAFIYSAWKRKANPELFRAMLILWLTLAAIAIPYFINYFAFQAQPGAHDVATRLGIAVGRVPGLATIGLAYLFYVLMAALIYKTYYRNDRRKAILFWIFLAAMCVAWNIQLVVGYVPAPNNWRRTFSPLLFIMIADPIVEWARRLQARFPAANVKRAIAITVFILTALVISKKIINAYDIYRQPEPRILQSYAFSKDITDSWAWINANLGKEPKILSNSFMTSLYLINYTSARPFLPLGILSLTTTGELEDRFLMAYKVFGVPEKTLSEILKSNLKIPCVNTDPTCPPDTEDNLSKNIWHLYGHYFRNADFNGFMIAPETITPEYIASLLSRYEKIKVNWNSIDAEYFYVGLWERQLGTVDLRYNQNLKLIYENPSIKIYRKI